MKEKIKPCPFCGGKPKVYSTPTTGMFEGFAQIGCERCNVTQIGTQYRNVKEATEAWNRRAVIKDEVTEGV